MEHRKARLIGNFCSVPLLPLIILLMLIGCSTQSPYEEAVGLIKQKKYEEAREVLNTIPMGDSLAEKAKLGLMVCNIGNLYAKKDYTSAMGIIDSGVVRDEVRDYVLNYPPSDELYSHVATLSMLIYGSIVSKQIQQYLDDEVNQENLQWYRGTNRDPEILWDGVMKTYSEEEYRAEDVDDYYGGTLTDPPFIRSIKLDKLFPPEEWKKEVEEIKSSMGALKSKIAEKKREYDAFEARHSGFEDVYDALNWLLGTNGEENTVWQSTEWSESPRYGKMTRMSFFFKRKGGLVFQWDTFLTDRDDNVLKNGGTDVVEIESVDGNTINLKWASGTRVSWEKVDENRFKFSSGMLVRTR